MDSRAKYDIARAVVFQPNGALVVAGYALIGSGDEDFALARYATCTP
jgi:hypothetical protein